MKDRKYTSLSFESKLESTSCIAFGIGTGKISFDTYNNPNRGEWLFLCLNLK